MKLINISFPHPVLSYYNDDIIPKLETDSIICDKPDSTNDEYSFNIKLKLKNTDILRLLASDRAIYTCEVDCQKTFLRFCLSSKDPSFTIKIPRSKVRGDIVFTCLVIAKKTIKDYYNSGFNSDYDYNTFDLDEGDLLVAFPQKTYNVDIKYDKLQSAGSFMQIRKDETGKERVFFDISGDKIDIVLPEALYDTYIANIRNDSNFNSVIHSSIVFNALVYALYNIRNKENMLWAKTIKYRLDSEQEFSKFDMEEDSDTIPEIAQLLLGNPYQRLFDSLSLIKEQNQNEEV